jgi:hypothetical protein
VSWKEKRERKESKKSGQKMSMVTYKITQRTRSWSLSAPATLPNVKGMADLPCIQHILDANRLTWPDVGHHPDLLICEIHPRQLTTKPTLDLNHRHAKEMQELAST